MITNILNALLHFRAEATLDTFEKVFSPPAAFGLWVNYSKSFGRDLIAFYDYLDDHERLLFEAHLAAGLPPAFFEPPACVECGGELSESDLEAGDVCLDCAVTLTHTAAKAAGGKLVSEIDHEAGARLATVRTRLEGGE
jgi:hypothetical protein